MKPADDPDSASGGKPGLLFSLLTFGPKVAARVRGEVFRSLLRLAGGRCGPGLRVEGGFRVRQALHPGLQLGRDVYIGRGTTIDCPWGGTLRIGDNVTLTQGVFVSAVESVSIGCDALIGEYCSIRDANHDHQLLSVPITRQPMVAAPVSIEDDVWLGRGVAVLAGATIGAGAIIGANAVVLDSIPAHAIAVGMPAKVVRQRFAAP